MTSPSNDGALAPARRSRTRFSALPEAAQQAPEYTDVEVARGQSDAVLGALARMQLKLDVLARENADTSARLFLALEQLSKRLDRSI